MNGISEFSKRLYYAKKEHWKRERLIFPSPAEIKFIRVMGGHVIVLPFVFSFKTGFPFAWVLSFGHVLRTHGFRREVRVGAYYIDFANDIKWGIEILGKDFHTDVVKEAQREEYLRQRGYRILYIAAVDLYRNPIATRHRAMKFIGT
jgi:hypothetical protein